MRIATLLQVQLFKELALAFGMCLASLLGLLSLGRMLRMRDLFLTLDLGFLDLAELFLYLTPFFLLLLMPVSAMLAVFLTFLRMSSERELMAVRTGGIRFRSLVWPAAAFCAVLMAVNFWIAFDGLSMGMKAFRAQLLEHARSRAEIILKPGVFNEDFKDLVIYTERYDERTMSMDEIFIRDERKENDPLVIVADEGQLRTDAARGELLLGLGDGSIYRQGDEQGSEVLTFESYAVRLDLGSIISGVDIGGDMKPFRMSWDELVYYEQNPPTDFRPGKLEWFVNNVAIEKQKRLVFPVACMVLGLFALPLACAFQGLKQYLGIFLALGFFLFYYTLTAMAVSLADAGTLSAAVGMWVPNLVFGVLTLWGLHMAAHEKAMHVMDMLSAWRPFWRRKREEGA